MMATSMGLVDKNQERQFFSFFFFECKHISKDADGVFTGRCWIWCLLVVQEGQDVESLA